MKRKEKLLFMLFIINLFILLFITNNFVVGGIQMVINVVLFKKLINSEYFTEE